MKNIKSQTCEICGRKLGNSISIIFAPFDYQVLTCGKHKRSCHECFLSYLSQYLNFKLKEVDEQINWWETIKA